MTVLEKRVKEQLVLTASEIVNATKGSLVSGNPVTSVTGFSIDTRTISNGDLFLAIKGARYDGHTFVEQAIARGACGAVVSDASIKTLDVNGRTPILVHVENTVLALQSIAASVRRRSGAKVVAITGSVGKTTTKEAIASILEGQFEVFRNAGNFNNHIGLPLSLLELCRRPDVAVMELGMNHSGEISVLVALAEPELRVWTNVSEVHSEFFSSVDDIADAKAELLEGVTSETKVFANANDARVMARVERSAGKVITFGIDTDADVMAYSVRDRGLKGMEADLRTSVGETRIETSLLGRGGLANVIASVAVALELGVPLSDVVRRAEKLSQPTGRGQISHLSNGVAVVDDSYNSSPAALRNLLDTVRHAEWSGRRVAVFGEMLELGSKSIELHRSCGRAAAEAGLDYLVTIGGDPVRALSDAAVIYGLPETAVTHVSDSEAAADLLMRLIVPGDMVLVKGSRGIKTERIVERLRMEFA